MVDYHWFEIETCPCIDPVTYKSSLWSKAHQNVINGEFVDKTKSYQHNQQCDLGPFER